tara:strand:- start:4176 stop:4361 length:186 start_codon:yes stop_codon:yes gene_type:complete
MKLHSTAIEKLIKIYSNYGGYREETRLRQALMEMDLTEYQQQTGLKKSVLVLTEDYIKNTT